MKKDNSSLLNLPGAYAGAGGPYAGGGGGPYAGGAIILRRMNTQ